MPIFQIPGVGPVSLPDGLKEDEYEQVVRKLVEQSGAEPEGRAPYTTGELFKRAAGRSVQQMIAGATYDLPAYGLAALAKLGFGGAEDKAKQFLEKGKQRYAEIEQNFPTQYPDFTKLESPGDYLGFGIEKAGEGLPQIATALLPGGAAAFASRNAAKLAGQEAMKAGIQRGLPAALAEREAIGASNRLLAGRAAAATTGTSMAQTIPDSFREIFETTGQLDVGLAAAAGAANSLLESYIPSKILGQLGGYGRIKLIEKTLERGGFVKEAAKIGAKSVLLGAQEGLTEGAQDVINGLAIKAIDPNYDIFSPENINKYINSMAGGFFGAIGPATVGTLADRTRPTLEPQQITPPRGGVSDQPAEAQLAAPQESIAPQQSIPPVTPAPQAVQPAVPPGGQQQVQPVSVPPPVQQVPPVQPPAPPQSVQPVQQPIPQPTPPPVQQPMPPVVQQPTPPPVQQPTPPPVQQQAPPPVPTTPPVQQQALPPVQQPQPPAPALPPAQQPSEATQEPPVAPSSFPLIDIPKAEEGPAPFVEPPENLGEFPPPEDVAAAMEAEKELLAKRAAVEQGKGSLWNALKGRISYEDIKDATPEREFRMLAGKSTSPNFKGLDLMIEDGDLDPWLPSELRSFHFDEDPMLTVDAANHIKGLLAARDFLSLDTKIALQKLDAQLEPLIKFIRDYEDELRKDQDVAAIFDEERRARLDEEQAALKEDLGQATPGVEAGVNPDVETPRPPTVPQVTPAPAVTPAPTPAPSVPPVTKAPAVTPALRPPKMPSNVTQEERDMFETLRAEMDALGLKDLVLDIIRPERIKRKTFEGYKLGSMLTSYQTAMDAQGREIRVATARVMQVALDLAKRTKSPEAQDPARIRRALHHETIHALRSLSLFTADEWKILSEASMKDWVRRQWPGDNGLTVKEIYKRQSKDTIIEEGVARAFENYTQGEFKPKGAVARIFQKTKEFFQKLANYAKGLGINEPEAEIFEKILSGEIGNRARRAYGDYQVFYDQNNIVADLKHSDAFNKWFGDSKVVGPDGKPKVMYHGTYRGGFSAFDRMKTTEWRRESMDTVGSWFSDNPSSEGGAAMYASGEGASIYPVYLSIQKPKVYKTFTAFLNDMHKSAGRDPKTQTPKGVGSTKELREKLKSQGYDGIKFERTSNQQLLDEVNELDELISNYKLKDPEYARELEQERKRAVKEFDKAGGSTEFDKQDVWVAFEPNQIKSVFNKGTWSPESDVILENRVGTEEIIMDAARLDIYPSESMDKLVMSGPEFKDIKKNTAEYIKDLSIDRADVLLSTLNLRQLGEMASSSLPQVKEFYKAVSDMLAMRDTRITLAADIAKRWVAFNEAHPKIAQVLADVMHAATIAGIDPDVNLEKIRSQELLDNWEIISKDKEALAIYRDVRQYYADSLEKYEKALKQRITESMEEGRPKTQALLELEQEFNKIRQTGPYFPLARFGDYWVSYNTVDENNKKVPEYYMFESRSEQRKFIDDLVKQGIKYKSGIKTSEMLSQGVPMSGFVRNMMELVDKTGGDTDTLKDGIWQMFLTMQPDLSARKHFIHRKKVKGYSNDALRAFAETSFHGAYHLARVQYNGRLEAIVLQAKKHKEDEPSIEAERYYEELLKRKEWVNAPEDVNSFTSWATSFSFMYFLTAPASALVNIAQTPMIAFPYLGAKFGFGNAFKELSRASKEFFASGISKEKGFYDITRMLKARAEEEGLSQAELQRRQEELQAITKLYEDGTLNRTQTLSLAGLAERPSDILQGGIGAVLRNRAFTTQQKVTYILGYSFNQAEVFNRQITAISAYRSARNKGMTHDLALQTAKDIVNETHFEYTNATKPRFMQGPTARILFQFKNYAQQMTYLLVRTVNEAIRGADQDTKTEARKRLGAILFMTGLFAGYEGLPLMWVIEGVMNAMFDDEDEPYDFFNSSKNNIADLFGSNAARILSGGLVSEILGGDIAGRVGMNGMWFRDSNRSVDEVQAFNQFVADLAGPFVGIGANIADGLKKINDGHYMRGTEAMLPPVLKDFLKVARFSTEGATTLRGDPIVGEISTWGLFMQALGFTPTDLARSYTAMGEIKGMENDLDRRRKRLIQQTALADMNGDIDELMEVKEKIARFNEKNPNNPITEETIKRSKSQRTKDSERAVRGIIVNPKREYLLEETRYLGEEE